MDVDGNTQIETEAFKATVKKAVKKQVKHPHQLRCETGDRSTVLVFQIGL